MVYVKQGQTYVFSKSCVIVVIGYVLLLCVIIGAVVKETRAYPAVSCGLHPASTSVSKNSFQNLRVKF